jgi:membrane protease subunit (stomatin/prohibitin family)
MMQGGGKKSQADIAREYMIAHAQQAAATWQCGRCGTPNTLTAEFCVQCAAT